MQKNDGKTLERIVRLLQEFKKTDSATKIFSNHKIKNRNGVEREFDIFIMTNVMGYNVSIAIECKDHKNRKITMNEVEAFDKKCDGFNYINKKIFISKEGFQSGAIIEAKSLGIELYEIDTLNENEIYNLLKVENVITIEQKFKIEMYQFIFTDNSSGFKVDKLLVDDISFSLKDFFTQIMKSNPKYFYEDQIQLIKSEEIVRRLKEKSFKDYNFKLNGVNAYAVINGEKKIISETFMKYSTWHERTITPLKETRTFKKQGEKANKSIAYFDDDSTSYILSVDRMSGQLNFGKLDKRNPNKTKELKF